MYQTSYTGLKPLQRNTSYMGGLCKWWYIPVEDIATFPRINAANQYLAGEPLLKAGKAWFGPVDVPRDRLGFEEVPQRNKAGILYKTKLEGAHIGDSAEGRVNLVNMAYCRFLVIGKVRAGGMHLLIGTLDSPLTLDAAYKSGTGPADTAGSTLAFTTEHISKAYVLSEFTGDVYAPVDSGDGGSPPMNQNEIIPFEAGANTSIVWTGERLAKFGTFPLIEVWLQDDPEELPYLHHGGSIEVDAPPPAFTEMLVKPGANVPGFIVIG